MIAEVSSFFGFPDGKTAKDTDYIGVLCKCGRYNYVKNGKTSFGDNLITCRACKSTIVLCRFEH